MNKLIDIVKDIIQPEKIIETHISYLLITDDYVYKIKKSVNLGFLDFEHLKKRKTYCLLEKELNSRFSKGIYLDVLKLVKLNGEYRLVNIENTLPAYEYILKMKRIKDEAFLHYRIEKKHIDCDDMYNIGVSIAEKLKNIKTDKAFVEEHGNVDQILFNINENFQQLDEFKNVYFDNNLYEFIKTKTYKFFKNNYNLFVKRINEGYIKNGHGDVRLEHIYFDDSDYGIIDCIEFNRRFRCNDVVADFTFLCMELDEKGYLDLSDSALSGFLSVFKDNDSKKLINFYKCYRALVRAKVNCFLLSEKGNTWQYFHKKCDETKRLVHLAYSYALCLEKPLTIIFYGLTGSGKSRNAKAFADTFGCAYLNTDICRKEMFHMQVSEKHYVPFGSSIYSEDNTLKVYDYLGERSYKMGLLGRLVVVDGTFLKRIYYDTFLNKRGLKIFKVKCEAPMDMLRKRLEMRINKKSISDGRLEILVEQSKILEDIGFDFLLHTENSIERHPLLVAKNLAIIDEK